MKNDNAERHDREAVMAPPMGSESCAASLEEFDIHAWVRAETDACRARTEARANGKPLALGDLAILDLFAIVMYGKKIPAVAEAFEKIHNSGAVVIGGNVDSTAAGGDRAANLPVRYHVNERMQALLTACRAGQFVDLQVH